MVYHFLYYIIPRRIIGTEPPHHLILTLVAHLNLISSHLIPFYPFYVPSPNLFFVILFFYDSILGVWRWHQKCMYIKWIWLGCQLSLLCYSLPFSHHYRSFLRLCRWISRTRVLNESKSFFSENFELISTSISLSLFKLTQNEPTLSYLYLYSFFTRNSLKIKVQWTSAWCFFLLRYFLYPAVLAISSLMRDVLPCGISIVFSLVFCWLLLLLLNKEMRQANVKSMSQS